MLKAALLLAAAWAGLRLLPFQTLRRLLAWAAEILPANLGSDQPSTPWAKTCLTQALAAQVLLERRGYPAQLHIGAVRGEQGQFQAHAWVESGGRIVIGGQERARYTPLFALGKTP